jgi:hypothetical protein
MQPIGESVLLEATRIVNNREPTSTITHVPSKRAHGVGLSRDGNLVPNVTKFADPTGTQFGCSRARTRVSNMRIVLGASICMNALIHIPCVEMCTCHCAQRAIKRMPRIYQTLRHALVRESERPSK